MEASTERSVDLPDGAALTIRPLAEPDQDALFTLFEGIVVRGEGWPQTPPLTAEEFHRLWVDVPLVVVATLEGALVGGYTVKANHPGRAAHIANAGYAVDPAFRGRGVGRALVADSIERVPAVGFDAIQFNLVFAANPARRLYEDLGWVQIGRLPEAVEGEDALIYWRRV